MTLATFVVAVLLISPHVGCAFAVAFHSLQSGQPQSQNSSPTSPEDGQSSRKRPTVAKPCSETQSKSTSQSGCRPASRKPGNRKHPAGRTAKPADTSPSKTVVTNGGAGEPSTAISSEEGQRRAARVRETNRLLDSADLNLKDVAVRGLSASQEVTVKQIRSYMDQAKAAENSGDVERAYTLANKANMLAADLNGR